MIFSCRKLGRSTVRIPATSAITTTIQQWWIAPQLFHPRCTTNSPFVLFGFFFIIFGNSSSPCTSEITPGFDPGCGHQTHFLFYGSRYLAFFSFSAQATTTYFSACQPRPEAPSATHHTTAPTPSPKLRPSVDEPQTSTSTKTKNSSHYIYNDSP